MSASIVCADYYHAMVKDRPGAAYELLSQLAQTGVSLMAFNAIPMGSDHTQLGLFPRSPSRWMPCSLRVTCSIGRQWLPWAACRAI